MSLERRGGGQKPDCREVPARGRLSRYPQYQEVWELGGKRRFGQQCRGKPGQEKGFLIIVFLGGGDLIMFGERKKLKGRSSRSGEAGTWGWNK